MKKTNPKYNKSRNGTWWPIKQYRFNTDDHPVTLDKDPKTEEIQLMLSYNEKQIVDGLTNMLMSKTSIALRVALQEHHRVKGSVHNHKGYMPAQHNRAVTKRDRKVKARVTATEASLAKSLATEWDVKVSDVIRVCCLELASLIRADKIKSLQGCKRLTQMECIKEWGKNNKDRPKGSKLTALKKAAQTASTKTEEQLEEEYAYWGTCLDHANAMGVASQFNHTEYHNGSAVAEYFDFDSFKHFYTQAYLGGADEDEKVAEALADDNKELAIKALAKQYATWVDGDDLDWEEHIEEATKDWEAEHMSEEDEAELEEWVNEVWAADAEPIEDDTKLEHTGYISKKIMSFDPRGDELDNSDIRLHTGETAERDLTKQQAYLREQLIKEQEHQYPDGDYPYLW